MSKPMKSPFEAALNLHGYAFHHRVVEEASRVGRDTEGRGWKVLSIECPVKIHGSSTRIDFVLEYRTQDSLNLLVAECKRVNPAYGSWCFAKTPHQTPAWVGPQLVVEGIRKFAGESVQSAGTGRSLDRDFGDRLFDIGFVLQTADKGDSHPVSASKDSLEDACSQVCRGLNGLINALTQDEYLYEHIANINMVRFLPVIFTTAQLWTSAVDLRTADLERGKVTLEEEPVQREWLFYQYPQSPGLKHEVQRGALSQDSFSDRIARDFVRSIGIVSAGGIREFLEKVWLDVLT
jgi:hypothetical protein